VNSINITSSSERSLVHFNQSPETASARWRWYVLMLASIYINQRIFARRKKERQKKRYFPSVSQLALTNCEFAAARGFPREAVSAGRLSAIYD